MQELLIDIWETIKDRALRDPRYRRSDFGDVVYVDVGAARRIIDTIPIDLPRPRKYELVTSFLS